MKLNVPLFTQKKDSVDCGHICLQMILAYYGIEKNYDEIKQSIKTHEIGTYTPQLGLYLLDRGFSTNIYTLNPSIFVLRDRNKSQKEILQIISTLRKTQIKSKNRKTLMYFETYMKQGGIVTPTIPDEECIRSELEKKRPLLALLTSNFLSGYKRDFNFHFNVITGIDDKHMYVNDPLSDKRGGKKKYLISDYLYAIHASAYGDMDNACIMSIEK